MGIEEIKKALISQINKIDDEKLLWKISTFVANLLPAPTVEEVYKEISSRYGNTLQRLAETEWEENKQNNS